VTICRERRLARPVQMHGSEFEPSLSINPVTAACGDAVFDERGREPGPRQQRDGGEGGCDGGEGEGKEVRDVGRRHPKALRRNQQAARCDDRRLRGAGEADEGCDGGAEEADQGEDGGTEEGLRGSDQCAAQANPR